MLPEDRINRLLKGQPIDRVPLYPFTRGFCARNVGYTIGSMYSDPVRSFEAQLWTREMYDYDESFKFSSACFGAWEFGGEIKFPSGDLEQSISVTRYPVQSEEDVDKLVMPDISTSGSIPGSVAFGKLQRQHGQKATIMVGTPFTFAANICGLDKLTRWLIRKPELAHRLLRLTTDYGIQLAQFWVDTFGKDNIEIRTSMPSESNRVISPRHFEQFALPYLQELHEKVLSMDVSYIYTHVCGDQNLNLPLLQQVDFGNPGIASFGHEVDIDEAIRYLGGKCIIAGNVQPAVIQNGTPCQVYELARQCIEKGAKAPRGFILGAGCELPPMAPPYNVYMLRKAIDDFGRYG